MLLKGLLPAAVLALASACAHAPAAGGAAEAEARGLLRTIAGAYEAARPEDLFALLDPDFPAAESFRDRIREFLLTSHQVTLDLILDHADPDPGGVSVHVRWNRGWLDAAGNHRLAEGSSEFVFRRRADASLSLLALHGDSPF